MKKVPNYNNSVVLYSGEPIQGKKQFIGAETSKFANTLDTDPSRIENLKGHLGTKFPKIHEKLIDLDLTQIKTGTARYNISKIQDQTSKPEIHSINRASATHLNSYKLPVALTSEKIESKTEASEYEQIVEAGDLYANTYNLNRQMKKVPNYTRSDEQPLLNDVRPKFSNNKLSVLKGEHIYNVMIPMITRQEELEYEQRLELFD